MKKLLVLGTLVAGLAMFATSNSAEASHRRSYSSCRSYDYGGGYGSGSSYYTPSYGGHGYSSYSPRYSYYGGSRYRGNNYQYSSPYRGFSFHFGGHGGHHGGHH